MTKKRKKKQAPATEKAEATEGQQVVLPNVLPAELEAMVTDRLRLFEKTATRKQRKWLTAYAICGQLMKASELSGVDWRSHYYWKKTDPQYLTLFEQAREISLDIAESEIYRRGIAGYEKYLSYKGKKGDRITEYSDVLAMFFLKGYRSHFRDGIGGSVVGPQQINLNIHVGPVQSAIQGSSPRPALPAKPD